MIHLEPRSAECRDILDHLSCCSPCFAEYECLVRRRRTVKVIKVSAIVVALLLAGITIAYHALCQ